MSNPVMHFELMGKDAIALQGFYAKVFGWKLSPPMPSSATTAFSTMKAKASRWHW